MDEKVRRDFYMGKAIVRCAEEMQRDKIIWRQLGGNEESKTLTTQSRQLRVTDLEENENRIFSPIIYQSCMHPEDIHIYDLKVTKISDIKWMIETHYQTEVINPQKSHLQVADWEAKIHKVDCKKCENCGRCGW